MKLHAALARALAGHDVQTMFGLIGDANMFLTHSFVHSERRAYVGAAHEAGAMFMGFGYASLTGQLGVVTVTHGPALTNTVTGLVEAARARLPLLLIAGDTATRSRTNIQDIAQRDVVLPTGAGFEQARTPDTALEDLAVAIRRAVVEQRPIVFNLPADFGRQEVEYQAIPLGLPVDQRLRPDPTAVRYAARRIVSADRPVVLAGRAAIPARRAVLRLADRIGAPVATTLKARDLFRGEPFDLGIAGGLAAPVSAEVLAASDLVISFGAGLNDYTTSKGALLSDRGVIAVASGPQPGSGTFDAIVSGDPELVADALVDALDSLATRAGGCRPSAGLPRPAAGGVRDENLARRLSEQYVIAPRPATAPGTVDAAFVLRRLDELLPAKRVVVSDGGRFMMESLRHIQVPDPQSFIFPENFGSIGTGMGAAIGAAAARRPRPVVLVCGDGGFMHGGVGEFNTAVRLGLDVIVVVCNDGGYGAEHVQFTDRGLDPSLSLFDWPDLVAVAEALGGDGVTVRHLDDLPLVAKAIDTRNRPLLIDLRLDVNHMTPMPH
ncbi:thiamine pyrophosphate-dependent enzyme [Actinoplanes sp. M2I2]|uniref:thiamine pyrophosphate-binding protein n=1 Tax=Actinoplanes sp. M2I2 TaxID=1734444 RepID=UPI0020218CA6|nr:thiamine pyrophosphate-dependent enzyme [Actinoplanes sp. M2I2]